MRPSHCLTFPNPHHHVSTLKFATGEARMSSSYAVSLALRLGSRRVGMPAHTSLPSSLLASQGVVKQFFNEKEVTSTLVMDALYSGCRQIDEHSRTWLEAQRIGGQQVRRCGLAMLACVFAESVSAACCRLLLPLPAYLIEFA